MWFLLLPEHEIIQQFHTVGEICFELVDGPYPEIDLEEKMIPKRIDLRVTRNDHESFKFVIKDEIGRPMDVSLFTAFACHIRKDKDNPEIIGQMEYDVDNSDLANGIIVLEIFETVTAILPRVSWYDFQFQNPDGRVSTPFQGIITLDRDVSKPPPLVPGSP